METFDRSWKEMIEAAETYTEWEQLVMKYKWLRKLVHGAAPDEQQIPPYKEKTDASNH